MVFDGFGLDESPVREFFNVAGAIEQHHRVGAETLLATAFDLDHRPCHAERFRSVFDAVTGEIDRATWDALGLAGRSDLTIQRVGTRHPSVSTLQNALSKVLRKKIPATGRFDSRLAEHVRQFQRNVALAPSGRVGPQTWAALTAAAARVPG